MITEEDTRHKRSKSGLERLHVVAAGSGFFFLTNHFFKQTGAHYSAGAPVSRNYLAPSARWCVRSMPGWRTRTFPCGLTPGGLQEERI